MNELDKLSLPLYGSFHRLVRIKQPEAVRQIARRGYIVPLCRVQAWRGPPSSKATWRRRAEESMKDRDISKLPKWAQSRIRVLEVNIRDLENSMAAMLSGENPEIENSRVWLEYLTSHSDKQFLPDKVNVSFHVDQSRKEYNGSISVRLEGDRLRVSGDYSIAVVPEASNVVSIKLEPWR